MSAVYEDHVKTVLRNRTGNLLATFGVLSAGFCTVLATFNSFRGWNLFTSFGPTILGFACAFGSTIGIVPLLAIKQRIILHQPKTTPNKLIFTAYAFSSIITAFSYLATLRSRYGPDSLGFGFLVFERNVLQFNDILIHVIWLQTSLSIAAFLVFQPFRAQRRIADFSLSMGDRLLTFLTRNRRRDWTFVLIALAINIFTFFRSGLERPILVYLIKNFCPISARPWFYSFLKSGRFNTTMLWHGFFVSAYTSMLWILLDKLVDIYMDQPMLVSVFSSAPDSCLASGMRSPNPYYQSIAVRELLFLSLTDKNRRGEIYNTLSKQGTVGSSWNALSTSALVAIGENLRDIKKLTSPPSINKAELPWPIQKALSIKEVETFLKHSTERALCASSALAALVCASLKEDQYGVVQRDVPKILEAQILYLLALEGLQSVATGLPKASPTWDTILSHVTNDCADPADDPTKSPEQSILDDIRMELQVLAPYLGAFTFPPRIATKIRLIFDYWQ